MPFPSGPVGPLPPAGAPAGAVGGAPSSEPQPLSAVPATNTTAAIHARRCLKLFIVIFRDLLQFRIGRRGISRIATALFYQDFSRLECGETLNIPNRVLLLGQDNVFPDASGDKNLPRQITDGINPCASGGKGMAETCCGLVAGSCAALQGLLAPPVHPPGFHMSIDIEDVVEAQMPPIAGISRGHIIEVLSSGRCALVRMRHLREAIPVVYI